MRHQCCRPVTGAQKRTLRWNIRHAASSIVGVDAMGSDRILAVRDANQRRIAEALSQTLESVQFQQASWTQNGINFVKTNLGHNELVGPKNITMEFNVISANSMMQTLLNERGLHQELIAKNAQLQARYEKLILREKQTLVGQIVYTFDKIAIQHVFRGDLDRPESRFTFTDIKNAAELPPGHPHALSDICQHRWKQLLCMWERIGWSLPQIAFVTHSLRQIRGGPAHLEQMAATMQAQKLISIVPAACDAMGPRFRTPGSNIVSTICRFILDMQTNCCTQQSVLTYRSSVFQMLDQVQL